jgi:hypothetical protein
VEVLRAVPGAHLDVQPDQVVRGEVQRGAEALDLERPGELVADTPRDAVGSDDEEREEDERDDGCADRKTDKRLPAAAPPPGVAERDR